MTVCLTSRELHRSPARARRETSKGPVIITERGRATHVLLSHNDYQRLLAESAGAGGQHG